MEAGGGWGLGQTGRIEWRPFRLCGQCPVQRVACTTLSPLLVSDATDAVSGTGPNGATNAFHIEKKTQSRGYMEKRATIK